MKTHNLTFADTVADRALGLLAATNMILFALFAATLLLAAPKARAEEAPACGGTDLLEQMRTSDPAALAKIEQEAAATPNGKGLLWKIEKDGVAPSFLFGTMHLTDKRVITLTPQAQAAFDAASTVVIETTEVLDPQKAAAALFANPKLTMLTDDTTLASLLSAEDKAVVEDGLKKRGIPFASVQKMQPWMLSSVISLPACETERKGAGLDFLDIKLARDAEAAGKELDGLETLVSQIEAMASLPLDFQMKGLVDTLKLGDALEDVFETMIVVYKSEETGKFWPLFRHAQPGQFDTDGFAQFQEILIDGRNVTMADNAEPIIAKGNAFIAVGSLHLPGEKGLVELLRQRGYTVTPAG